MFNHSVFLSWFCESRCNSVSEERQTFLMLIRRLGILYYLLLPPSKVVAVFKELVRLLMLWFLQRNSSNVFCQFSFLRARKKKNKLLFSLMAPIWNRHLCEHCFPLSLNKTWWNELYWYKAGLSDHWGLGAPQVLQGRAWGMKSRSRELFSDWGSCVGGLSVLTRPETGLGEVCSVPFPSPGKAACTAELQKRGNHELNSTVF